MRGRHDRHARSTSTSSAARPAPGSRRTSNPAARGQDRARPPATTKTRDEIAEARVLQRRLFDAGYAGISFPAEYGGRGLTAAHERAFREEAAGYVTPDLGVAGSVTYRADRPLDPGPRLAGVPRAAHPEDPLGRGDLVPVLLRARGRLGPRRHPHPGHARRRPLDPQRLQDLEQRRLLRRLGDVPGPHRLGRPQAPRPDVVRRARPTPRASRSARSRRSTATPSSARSSSTTSIVTDDDVIGEVNRGWSVTQTMLVYERGAGESSVSTLEPRAAGARSRRPGPARRPHRRSRSCARPSPGPTSTTTPSSTSAAGSPSACGPSADTRSGRRRLQQAGRRHVHARSGPAWRSRSAAARRWRGRRTTTTRSSRRSTTSTAASISIAAGTNEMQRNGIGERVLGPAPRAELRHDQAVQRGAEGSRNWSGRVG